MKQLAEAPRSTPVTPNWPWAAFAVSVKPMPPQSFDITLPVLLTPAVPVPVKYVIGELVWPEVKPAPLVSMIWTTREATPPCVMLEGE